MNQRQFHLIKLMKRINLFRGFELKDIQQLFKICSFQTYQPDQVIYKVGTQSQEMLILLSGQLTVLNGQGEVLARIPPGSPIGEMGVFTGEPRSATIAAVQQSTAIVLSKMDLHRVLRANRDMRIVVLQNLVPILCERLAAANRLNDEHIETIMKMQNQLVEATGKTSRDLGEDDDEEEDEVEYEEEYEAEYEEY